MSNATINTEWKPDRLLTPQDLDDRRDQRWTRLLTLGIVAAAMVIVAIVVAISLVSWQSGVRGDEIKQACVESGGMPLELEAGDTCVRPR